MVAQTGDELDARKYLKRFGAGKGKRQEKDQFLPIAFPAPSFRAVERRALTGKRA